MTSKRAPRVATSASAKRQKAGSKADAPPAATPAPEKTLYLVFKRSREPGVEDCVDRILATAYLTTEAQRNGYAQYAQKKRDAAKTTANSATRVHAEAMESYIAEVEAARKAHEAKLKAAKDAAQTAGTRQGEAPTSAPATVTTTAPPAASQAQSDSAASSDAVKEASQPGASQAGPQDTAAGSLAGHDKADNSHSVAPDRERGKPEGSKDGSDAADEDEGASGDEAEFEKRIAEERRLLGEPIGELQGWIMYQDAPSMRGLERFETFDKPGRSTLALAVELFGPEGSSRVPSCPDLANGGLFVIDRVRVEPEHRSRGYGMRLVLETMANYLLYWRTTIVLPLILDSASTRAMTEEQYGQANRRLADAFRRNGFAPLGATRYLIQDRRGFVSGFKSFPASRRPAVVVASPPLCCCEGGLSPRMKAALRASAELSFDLATDALDWLDPRTGDDFLEPLAFLPPFMTLTKTHVKGFVHILGTVGGMCKDGVTPDPAAIERWLDENRFYNWKESWAWAQWRNFVKDGGSVVDVLDFLMHRVEAGTDIGLEFPDGKPLRKDKKSLTWLDATLPLCREHDDDFEGLRHRWWSECGRPASIRGPYRGYLVEESLDEGGRAKALDEVPVSLLLRYERENGKLPAWVPEALERAERAAGA
ncbi:uncharacterized protein PFL1_01111 [Pseudozyma flocculosa PF-1]|uniref:Uncharacterized protein n=1 Tax=Pseudozyma flocculosa TaxID=84751 RepID=A0A5C3FED3_9BASI|nr:uncharacterized protein PFL1_01111 [Pseudozyma flocculosa PF-1]EPQ31779.1 hypothetical protein PFL1_01111 [Pseudozyma flocculosa PF-1]SPO41831.1 uncharacterized protein PSFLO_07313 [Pseudozyma flocculosa]